MITPNTNSLDSSLKAKLGRWWFYLSQVLSVIGLAGILDDIKSWLKFVEWGTARIREISPDLSALLLLIGGFIRSIVSLWRSILHPPVDFLLGWLPFQVPVLAKDLLLVCVFVAVGWSRADGLTSPIWNRMRARASRIAEEFGVKGTYTYASLTSLDNAKQYVQDHQKDRSSLQPYQKDRLERLEAELGDKAIDFANAVVRDSEMLALDAEWSRALFVLGPVLKRLVAASALVVVLFLSIDLFMS